MSVHASDIDRWGNQQTCDEWKFHSSAEGTAYYEEGLRDLKTFGKALQIIDDPCRL